MTRGSVARPAAQPHRRAWGISLGLYFLACLPPERTLAAPGERPNILFIYTDDQARWGVRAYGNREIHTPNLDRLAAEGALFLNAFTLTPVCSPSRATLLTGRYPTELGIEDWIDPAKEPEIGLSPAIATWPKLLQKAGYRTGLVGKWHLGTQPAFHPARNGFDWFAGFLAGGIAPMDPELEVDGKKVKFEGGSSQVLAEQAIEFLRASKGRPFLLSLHFRAPHAPYGPVPEEDAAPYRDLDPMVPGVPGLRAADAKRLTREYYASITSMDRGLGRVLAAIDDLGLRDSTLVIFTSDNGYMIGHHGLHHKGNAAWLVEGRKGHRPNCFDDAIRVPLLVRWPGTVRPGRRIEETVSNLDFFPTLLGAARIPVPAGYEARGRSFLAVLRDDVRPLVLRDDTILGQYDMHHYERDRMRMLRTRAWKLVRHFIPGGADELYDLERDPGELENLAGRAEQAGVLDRMGAELKRRMQAIGDPLASGK